MTEAAQKKIRRCGWRLECPGRPAPGCVAGTASTELREGPGTGIEEVGMRDSGGSVQQTTQRNRWERNGWRG